MARIEVLETGHVDRSDSAFATLVRLDDGQVLCGFSVGGGAHASGGTHCARSADGGRTWTHQGLILGSEVTPATTNHLRLSRTRDGAILAYGQRDRCDQTGGGDGCEAVFCRSEDGGRSWSPPRVLPAPLPGPYEISNPVVVTDDGRWLAPAATHHGDLYGETVVLFESCDGGDTWPAMHTVFEHPQRAVGYLEQKVIQSRPNELLAVAWRQDYGKDVDLTNGYSFSLDGGRTWDGPHDTGIEGQTMTPLWLGADRFLVLYNRRWGRQSIQMCLVRARGADWSVEFEDTMWDARATLDRTEEASSNAEIPLFKFGYPMPLRLDDETVLATHWCEENGMCGIRWTRMRLVF